MMNFHIITLHPEFIQSYCQFGVFASALRKQIASLNIIPLRNFAVDKSGTIDGKPYGGGDGMVLRCEPIEKALSQISANKKVILTSPQGRLWKQEDAETLSEEKKDIVFICGRFGGVDKRAIDLFVDEEVSVGNYILSGGELASLSILDSTLRLLPGVLGNNESALFDTFSLPNNRKKEHPLYTKPRIYKGKEVPPVLLSGDHNKIKSWKKQNTN
tara:strand:+ start:129 stop:773 length:645 start_codon:yes stop_codon:yes gene_type:complete